MPITKTKLDPISEKKTNYTAFSKSFCISFLKNVLNYSYEAITKVFNIDFSKNFQNLSTKVLISVSPLQKT